MFVSQKVKGYPLQYSGLEKSMDYIWVAKSWTQLSDFLFTSLDYKTNLHKRKKIEILSSIFSNRNGMRLGKKLQKKK